MYIYSYVKANNLLKKIWSVVGCTCRVLDGVNIDNNTTYKDMASS